MKRVYLIDAKNLVYRSHYGALGLTDSKGRPTSVLHEFPQTLLKIQEKYGEGDMAIMWDNGHPLRPPPSGSPKPVLWRQQIASGSYKANRKTNPESVKALAQIKPLAKFLDILGVLQLGVPSLEADDLMGLAVTALRREKGIKQIYILSNDRDHYQLVQDQVMILYPSRTGIRLLDADEIFRDTELWPHEWAAYKAIAGDSSDSFKAIKGVGPKQALQMIRNGVDPSQKDFMDQPVEVRRKYAHLRPYWASVHRCYRLSRIPLSVKDADFPKPVLVETEKALSALRNEREREMTEELLDLRLRRLIDFLSGYDLDQLISRKRAFFKGARIT